MGKLLSWFVLVLFCLVTAVFTAGCGSKADRQATPKVRFTKEQTVALDSFLVNLHNTLPLPGLAIAVLQEDAVYYKAVGYSHLAEKIPFTDSTIFFTGNLSEPMVATAIMTLVQSGKITLDDLVTTHLPYFRLAGNSYQAIKIKHLLTHTSGIPRHDAMWDLPTDESNALEATTRSVSQQEPEFTPAGSRVKRSAYNYDILADLIAKVSGTSFEEYVKTNVFRPLWMQTSSFNPKLMPGNRLAKPHKVANWLTYQIVADTLYPYNREHAGSIGFHTSLKDITAWMYMLLHGGQTPSNVFMHKAVHGELTQVQYKTDSSSYVGLGWEIIKTKQQVRFHKQHQLGGFSAALNLIPAQGIGVFVISNIGEDFHPELISEPIIAWLNGSKLLLPKKPISIALGRKLDSSGSLDSAFQMYLHLKQTQPEHYDYGVEALSQLGVNLMYRVKNRELATRVFRFCADQFPASAYAHLNLAEVYLLDQNREKALVALQKAKELPQDDAELPLRVAYIEEMLQSHSKPNPAL